MTMQNRFQYSVGGGLKQPQPPILTESLLKPLMFLLFMTPPLGGGLYKQLKTIRPHQEVNNIKFQLQKNIFKNPKKDV